MTIEFDEGERTWARNNDQAERDSDIAYQQEQDEDKKFFVEWVEGYGNAPSKLLSLHDIKTNDEFDGNLLRDSNVLDDLEFSKKEVVTYNDPSGEVKFTRIVSHPLHKINSIGV